MPAKVARALEAAVVIGALLTIPLTMLGEAEQASPWVRTADWAVWAVFLLEYGAMFATSADRVLYVRKNPLNLAVIILSYPHLPFLFGLVRLARLGRLLRLLRLMSVTVRAVTALRTIFWRRGMVCVAAISSFVILAGGAALALLEPQTVRGGLVDGIWWAIVTASTVGYGDIAPNTHLGRLIAVLLMLSGVGLMSTLAASITAYFLGQEENAAFSELNARMRRIEKSLNTLLANQTTPEETTHQQRQSRAEIAPSTTEVRDEDSIGALDRM